MIEISIDENTKYSIKEYREALYKEVAKKKSRSVVEDTNVLTLSTHHNSNSMNSSMQHRKREEEKKKNDELKRQEELRKHEEIRKQQ